MLILRKLLPLMAMLGVSLAFAAPSTAARLHGLEHSETQIAAGQHHHHAADGSIDGQDAPDGESGKDRDAKGVGHAHASSAAGECIETAAAAPPSAAPSETQLAASGHRDLPALDPPPRDRPPRTA